MALVGKYLNTSETDESSDDSSELRNLESYDNNDTTEMVENHQNKIIPSSESSVAASTDSHLNECYFAVKGAAIVLPRKDSVSNTKRSLPSDGGPIQVHLHHMLALLQHKDTLKMGVKLESIHEGRNRYLAIVSRTLSESHDECCLLGFDCNQTSTIGLVLPIWANTVISLDGDGGFSITCTGHHLIFKPVSVQAMWSALQSLHRACNKAQQSHHIFGAVTHSWVSEYEQKIGSDRSCLNEWHFMEDLNSRRPPTPDPNKARPTKREETEIIIRSTLRSIMMSVDLDEVTCKFLRVSVEESLNMDLRDYRTFINDEMLNILGQLDAPSLIFDYLYLGSEWNASNLEELQANGVTHVLNVTREIDNFFPGMFEYTNIRVYDEETTDLLKYWDKTYRLIIKVKNTGGKCLVHCRMGKSRSASVAIAYAMKAYYWSLQKAYDYVKGKRDCIIPNDGFMKQLEIYEGILDASRQRHSKLWRSKSETNLMSAMVQNSGSDLSSKSTKCSRHSHPADNIQVDEQSNVRKNMSTLEVPGVAFRPKSWSPDEFTANEIFPHSAPSSPGECRRHMVGYDDENTMSPLERGASIRDRISNLETNLSKNSTKDQANEVLPLKKTGLVLNLTNQFESVSKPGSPVDDDSEIAKLTEEEPPVLSQTKPPVLRHEATLVKPQVTSCNAVHNDESKACSLGKQAKRSLSSTSVDSGIQCHKSGDSLPKSCIEALQSCSSSVTSPPCSPNACSSDNDHAGKSGIVLRSSSSGAVLAKSPQADNNRDSVFTYDKEDIPWTPGTVRRTTEQLEQDSLKRTKSFDSALKLKHNKNTQNKNSAASPVVQRSQSLSAHGTAKVTHPQIVVPPVPPVRTSSVPQTPPAQHSSTFPMLHYSVMASQQSPEYSVAPKSDDLQHYDSDEGLVMSVRSMPEEQKVDHNLTNDPCCIGQFESSIDVDSPGVVKRLTKELEAKTGKPIVRKDRVVIVDQDGKEWISDHRCIDNSDCVLRDRRRNRTYVKSENMSSNELFSPSYLYLQRSNSTGNVIGLRNLLPLPQKRLNTGHVRGNEQSASVLSASHNKGVFCNKQISTSKPPPATKVQTSKLSLPFGLSKKLRKHQQDFGKNHPVNKISKSQFKSM